MSEGADLFLEFGVLVFEALLLCFDFCKVLLDAVDDPVLLRDDVLQVGDE